VTACREAPFTTDPTFIGIQGESAIAVVPIWMGMRVFGALFARQRSCPAGEVPWEHELENLQVLPSSGNVIPIGTARLSLGEYVRTIPRTNPTDFSHWRSVGPHGRDSAMLIPSGAMWQYLDELDSWRKVERSEADDLGQMYEEASAPDDADVDAHWEESEARRTHVANMLKTRALCAVAWSGWRDLSDQTKPASDAVKVVSALPSAFDMRADAKYRLHVILHGLEALERLKDHLEDGLAISLLELAGEQEAKDFAEIAQSLGVDEGFVIDTVLGLDFDAVVERASDPDSYCRVFAD
jgi:hypothetical protein